MYKHLFSNIGRSIVIVYEFAFENYCILFSFCFEFYPKIYIENSMQDIVIRSFFQRLEFKDIEKGKIRYSALAFICTQVPLMP